MTGETGLCPGSIVVTALKASSSLLAISLPLLVLMTGCREEAPDPALVSRGETVFGDSCAACHSVVAADGNLTGPNLFGVYGRKAGAVSDYEYSAAMRGAGFNWTMDRLQPYLTAPESLVPGTTMTFEGIANESDRKSVIAYLQAQR